MPIWITYDTVTLQTGNCIVATTRFSEYAAATAARLKSRLKCGFSTGPQPEGEPATRTP
jgi:hypothetical protein